VNELALFAGAGGGILGGLLLGWRTVCAVEIDPYCRSVLMQRQCDGILQPFPIWDDVRSFDGRPWRGIVDVVSAGFPCQPWSIGAGEQSGEVDARNLWPDTIRIIREVGPRFALLENVPNLLSHQYAAIVFGELVESGFDCRWDCLPAAAFGADHFRERLWIVANARSAGSQRDVVQEMARAKKGCQHTARRIGAGERNIERFQRSTDADFCRKSDAVPGYVDRLKALGNAQCPPVVAAAWRLLNI
jgi:DNA (cytosine-5)-methyltransferase 1